MRSVSRFEAKLLRVLRAFFQRVPREQALTLLANPLPRPKCLSRDAVALIQDTLAKGCVQFLARRGWMRERFLRAGKIAEGRLWQRTTPVELGLSFSSNALEFLVQVVSGTLGSSVPTSTDLSLGDRLLFVLAFAALEQTEAAEQMRKKWPPLQQDGLCRLLFLEALPDKTPSADIDWLPWTTGLGACILESLEGWVAERWIDLERKKESISTAPTMRRIGATQDRVYGEYLDALALAQRRDLARCFLEAARHLLQDQPTSRRWIRNLDVRKVRIADRLVIYREALAFLRQMNRLHEWHQETLDVGYFDEGYQASQLWKADWERHDGDRLYGRARAILREVEPLQ